MKSTEEIKVPKKIVDQVIGQEEAVKIIKKASLQRRHVLLIGEAGTGKSLIGQALAQLLPKEKLVDIMCLPNDQDDNNPLIRTMPKGKGKTLVQKLKLQALSSGRTQNIFLFILLIIAIISPWWIRQQYGDIMAAASLIGSTFMLIAFVLFMNLGKRLRTGKVQIPKMLINNDKQQQAPFHDATGAHAGALLGDVLHDPLQTFLTGQELHLRGGKQAINKIVNNLLKKHKNKIIKKGTYQAIHTNKNELKVLAEKNNQLQDVEVLSVNKYKYNGELIKITTESGKTLITTPEHKIATKSLFGKKSYKRADKLKRNQNLFTIPK